MLFLNSKIALDAVVPRENLPPSCVSNRYDDLLSLVEASDHPWIMKPANEGCGADVFFIDKNDKNARALMQSATGNEVSRHEMYGRATIGLSRTFTTLQAFVPNVKLNEKRILIAGGMPFAGFRRFLGDVDHRGNVTLGVDFEAPNLTSEEDAFCRRLGWALRTHGIRYCGVDLAYPYVFELNLANPGGLNYEFRATGIDRSDEAVALVLASFEADE
ncbi:MAG: ATP-grasp domain-containing protein [Salinarimonas sp.]